MAQKKYDPNKKFFNSPFDVAVASGGLDSVDQQAEADSQQAAANAAPQTKTQIPSPLGDSNWIKPPDYRLPDGSINPKYRSGRGASALEGGAIGAKMHTGNPLFDAGAILGGILGGALNKNLAGRVKYQEEVAQVMQDNQITEAHQRYLERAAMIQKQQEQMQIQHDREARYQATAQIKDRNKQADEIVKNINSTSGDERRFYQIAHARLFGLPDPENVDENYMVNWKHLNTGGVVNYLVDGNGAIKEATYKDPSTGEEKSLANLKGIKDLWTIAAIQNKLRPDNVVDEKMFNEAFKQADDILAPRKSEFKTNKGQFNAIQYNAQRFQIANKILATKKANPELQTVQMELNVDGSPILIDVPLTSKANPAPLAPSETNPNSEGYIYNGEAPPVDMNVYKGVDIRVAQWATGFTNADEINKNISMLQGEQKKANGVIADQIGEQIKALSLRLGQISAQPSTTQPSQTTPKEDETIKVETKAHRYSDMSEIPVNTPVTPADVPLEGVDKFLGSVEDKMVKDKNTAPVIRLTIGDVPFKYNRKTKVLTRIK